MRKMYYGLRLFSTAWRPPATGFTRCLVVFFAPRFMKTVVKKRLRPEITGVFVGPHRGRGARPGDDSLLLLHFLAGHDG